MSQQKKKSCRKDCMQTKFLQLKELKFFYNWPLHLNQVFSHTKTLLLDWQYIRFSNYCSLEYKTYYKNKTRIRFKKQCCVLLLKMFPFSITQIALFKNLEEMSCWQTVAEIGQLNNKLSYYRNRNIQIADIWGYSADKN